MPATIPLTFYVGEQRDHPIPAGTTVGAGWSALAQIRAQRGGQGPVLHEFSTATATITLAGTAATLAQVPADFTAAVWRTAYYDVLIISPAGVTTRIAEGPVVLSPATTRPGETPIYPPAELYPSDLLFPS